MGIEQVSQVKILAVAFCHNFSPEQHVNVY